MLRNRYYYLELRERFAVQLDLKQAIGKRYARMDEAGAPYCFTIDGDTLKDHTVTVRHRDTLVPEGRWPKNASPSIRWDASWLSESTAERGLPTDLGWGHLILPRFGGHL